MNQLVFKDRIELDKFIQDSNIINYGYIERGSFTQNLNGPGSDHDKIYLVFDKRSRYDSRYRYEAYKCYNGKTDPSGKPMIDEDEYYITLDGLISMIKESNPNYIEMISVKPEFIHLNIPEFDWVFKNPELFYSKQLVKRVIGFASNNCKKSGTKIAQKFNQKEIEYFDKAKFSDFLSVDLPWVKGNSRISFDEYLEYLNIDRKYLKRVELSRDDRGMDELIKLIKALPAEYGALELLDKIRYINSISKLYIDWYQYCKDNDQNATVLLWAQLFGSDRLYDLYELVETPNIEKSKWGIYGDDAMETGGNLYGSAASAGIEEYFVCGYLFFDGKGFKKFNDDKKSYKNWDKNKNTDRYRKNLDGETNNYDTKNMMHGIRSLLTFTEMFSQPEPTRLKIFRDSDAEYLKSIKYSTSGFTVEELTEKTLKLISELHEIGNNSNYPDEISGELINRLHDSIKLIVDKI